MAHFAKLDDNNRVLQVVVVDNNDAPTEEAGQQFLENVFGWQASKWKQTSYNTYGGIHYDQYRNPSADQSKALRANFAGIGDVYNQEHDLFTGLQPFPSWTLNTTTGYWEAPVPKPELTDTIYAWDEDTQSWIENNDGRHDIT